MRQFRLHLQRLTASVAILTLLSACGGGGSGSVSTGGSGSTPAPTGTCSLASRQSWAAQQLNEWYLFPETLPTSLSATPYTTVQDYIDALTATARAQNKDRYFTYITSIAEENAYYNSGSNAGFGIRLSVDSVARRLLIAEAFEGTPALTAGIDRGTEILAIGSSAATLRNVSDIIASEGSAGITNALNGDTRTFRFRPLGGSEQTATITRATYTLTPVSARYGAKIIDDAGKKVGYINLRTFINTAETPLRTAFADFRAQGVSEVIIDLRYNGGGLVSIATLINNLLARDRTSSQVANYTTFRASKASNNETTFFSPQSQSITPTRIAFIGTGGSASASELVMNTFIPLLGNRAALVGTNTYGKPVGQIAVDRTACDDRLRVVAFATENSARQGAYYTGLASFMGATCQASDDVTRPLGDPQEASIKTALDFLAGRSCTPITASSMEVARSSKGGLELVSPTRPSTAQREVPGSF
ncbi:MULTISPECIES: S41 family peptidase [unclassified Sphingomonas]|uniref:S41 family peptidase n=1 Tax=unclassified Sphingomonas TaxID=196159 RepID=UPI0008357CA3|nr:MULTISPECIES: S41 family peptidase [unclassified Sphingomonas]